MRKLSILEAATKLFGDLGYDKATTALISKEAGVSEALIFKHFKSKEGLLEFILKEGYKQIIVNNKGMVAKSDPLQLIYSILDLPRNLIDEKPAFWKMQARLIDLEICKKAHQRFMAPLNERLYQAFKDLNTPEPEKEMEFLIFIIESLWIKHAKESDFQSREMITFVKKKYY